MALIYITDETKEKLDRLIEAENRNISLEVNFLCKERLKQLNLPENANSSVKSENDTTKTANTQANTLD